VKSIPLWIFPIEISVPNTVSIWNTAPNLDGRGARVVFLSYFFIVAKWPSSRTASAGVGSKCMVFLYNVEKCWWMVSILLNPTLAQRKSSEKDIVLGRDVEGLSTHLMMGIRLESVLWWEIGVVGIVEVVEDISSDDAGNDSSIGKPFRGRVKNL
jgi:hypothetical protein